MGQSSDKEIERHTLSNELMEMLFLQQECMKHEVSRMKQENEVLLQQNARLSNEVERKTDALKQHEVQVRIHSFIHSFFFIYL